MSEEVKTMIAKYALELIFAVLGIVLTLVAKKIQKKLAQKENGEIALATAQNIVIAVEQMYQGLAGPEKLEKALGLLTDSLKAKGIKLDPSELRVLIEGAVGEMNLVFVKDKTETPAE